MSLSEYKIDN